MIGESIKPSLPWIVFQVKRHLEQVSFWESVFIVKHRNLRDKTSFCEWFYFSRNQVRLDQITSVHHAFTIVRDKQKLDWRLEFFYKEAWSSKKKFLKKFFLQRGKESDFFESLLHQSTFWSHATTLFDWFATLLKAIFGCLSDKKGSESACLQHLYALVGQNTEQKSNKMCTSNKREQS